MSIPSRKQEQEMEVAVSELLTNVESLIAEEEKAKKQQNRLVSGVQKAIGAEITMSYLPIMAPLVLNIGVVGALVYKVVESCRMKLHAEVRDTTDETVKKKLQKLLLETPDATLASTSVPAQQQKQPISLDRMKEAQAKINGAVHYLRKVSEFVSSHALLQTSPLGVFFKFLEKIKFFAVLFKVDKTLEVAIKDGEKRKMEGPDHQRKSELTSPHKSEVELEEGRREERPRVDPSPK